MLYLTKKSIISLEVCLAEYESINNRGDVIFIKLTAILSSDTWHLSNYFHTFDDEQFSGKDTFVNVPPSCLQQLLLERV